MYYRVQKVDECADDLLLDAGDKEGEFGETLRKAEKGIAEEVTAGCQNNPGIGEEEL